MPERQVLFRIDAKLLDRLDRRLARDGYTTRNAWFKEVVSGYAAAARSSTRAASRTTKSARTRKARR